MRMVIFPKNLLTKTLLAVSFFLFTGWSSLMAADWKKVEKLVEEQKLKEAEKYVEEILALSEKKSNTDWTRSLVTLAQLRTGLHGYETAVEKLKLAPWPTQTPDKIIVELFYAKTLFTYLNEYSWEIRQREKSVTKEKVDLKNWTSDQIFSEALQAYNDIWIHRSELGTLSIKSFPNFITPNNFPGGVRDTMRDLATYQIAESLANTGNWSASDSSELYKVSLSELLVGKTGMSEKTNLDDSKQHPAAKLVYVLKDLESWHYSKKNEAGALEARIAVHTYLHQVFSETADKKTIRTSLENYLKSHQENSWAGFGFSELATLQQEAGELVNAHKTASECVKKYKNLASERCRYIAAVIEQPAIELNAMALDGKQKRSLEVKHKNIGALYFRAYKVDLLQHINGAKDYNLLPAYKDFANFVKKKADFSWKVNLEATPDFNLHKTYVTPPIDKFGFYVVIASAEADFNQDKNLLLGVNFNVSDLVVVHENKNSELSVSVVAGSSGKAVPGAEVKLFRFNYKSGHELITKTKTDKNGGVKFSLNPQNSYFVVASLKDDISIQADYIYAYQNAKPSSQKQTIIYTDRAVYRPNQTIKWKVIAYTRSGEGDSLRLDPKTKIEVSLQDGNYQSVQKIQVTTNAFGTASGEFLIPDGRLLGQWQISTNHGGNAWLKVEEYKRPTFEISFSEIKEQLRLNANVSIQGSAKYYFGSPVSEGKAVYKVERTPIFPWWWRYYFWTSGAEKSEIVASGSTDIKADGTFNVSFLPEARIPTNEFGWSKQYRYVITVDVTDPGGETRSESTQVTAGFITIQAIISKQQSICFADAECNFEVSRLNLNGGGEAGQGTYKIVALEAPTSTLTPSELPVKIPETNPDTGEKNFHTAGDLQKPRWNNTFVGDEYYSNWREGKPVSNGTLTHDKNGLATIKPGRLSAGVYKIEYSTKDNSGRDYKTWQYVMAAASGYAPKLPVVLEFERSVQKVGSTVRLFASVGFSQKTAVVRLYHKNKIFREVKLASNSEIISIPIDESLRGGISAAIDIVSDHHFFRVERQVFVPWDNKELSVSFESLREVMKPGAKETLTIKVKGANAKTKAAEVMAFMYDKSLDLIARLNVFAPVALYPSTSGVSVRSSNLKSNYSVHFPTSGLKDLPDYSVFFGDQLVEINGYGIGGGGGFGRGHMRTKAYSLSEGVAMDREESSSSVELAKAAPMEANVAKPEAPPPPSADSKNQSPPSAVQMRENFAETAFFAPHLVTNENGEATVSFTLPDSLTTWHVWAVGLAKDFSSGLTHQEVRSAKDLMVRLYSPRFFREGDKINIKIVANNATQKELEGEMQVSLVDATTGADLGKEFKIDQTEHRFTAKGEGSTSYSLSLNIPPGSRSVKLKAVVSSGLISDGEIKTIPVLPGRMHLVQSRFVALKDQTLKKVVFSDLKDSKDSSLINEKIVATVDGQLFFSTLKALPYLIEYPYECTEQTLNRFLSAGIMSSLFNKNPKLRKAASEFSSRKSEYEPWSENDPNKRMQLEESPWLNTAKGGKDPSGEDLVNILKAEVADRVKQQALSKLQKYQTASGGFPWFPGGSPSPYMTLYLVHGFAKAQEFDIPIPKDMVKKAWQYLAMHYKDLWSKKEKRDYEFLTYLNFAASSFSDKSVYNDVLSEAARKEILDYSFKHWKNHSPYLKLMLSLTLHRMNRSGDAALVLDSVLDSATTSDETGTSWAAEDRSWLWYNDTIETHAFALRVLTEIKPQSPLNSGIVHWLFLNKKLNQWKSTKATAEVIYSLATWMRKSGDVFPTEKVSLSIGSITKNIVFPAEKYVGKQFVEIKGPEVIKDMADISFKKETGGLMFASATWHYSTETLPEKGRGDFFAIERTYFLRKAQGSEMVLIPFSASQTVDVGDEVEVQISIKNKHQAEYIHLRDPRPAGFEPVALTSGHKWNLGISWFEEIRDNGTNFFFDWLPEGEYTFKYRIRAANAGVFKAMPAEIQSMYAPEFNAFSSGRHISVK